MAALKCCRCQRGMNDGLQSMRPLDPKGTPSRRWVCNRCEGFAYINEEAALLASLEGKDDD